MSRVLRRGDRQGSSRRVVSRCQGRAAIRSANEVARAAQVAGQRAAPGFYGSQGQQQDASGVVFE